MAPGYDDASEPAQYHQRGIRFAAASPRAMQRTDEEEQAHEAHGYPLEDAQRTRIKVHDVLRIKGEPHQAGANDETKGIAGAEGPGEGIHKVMMQCGIATLRAR
jgi:hypothetical protein